MTFQDIIACLNNYWQKQHCLITQPVDTPIGAATFHPHTFLRAIGPEPWQSAYTQTCRRPTDGRYGQNPNRLQQYFQYQVMLKPAPHNPQELYLNSLKALGIDPIQNDIRFVEDNWESPSLGAWGIGWEVWLAGMEITQFTYFQQIGGLDCNPITCEITYGLERIAMQLQEKDNVYDLIWGHINNQNITYGEMFQHNEKEQSAYNFEHADTHAIQQQIENSTMQFNTLIEQNLVLPACEKMMDVSHLFNLLDARKAIGATQRAEAIKNIRDMSKKIANAYLTQRETQSFPLCKKP